jgi:recombination protein RecT
MAETNSAAAVARKESTPLQKFNNVILGDYAQNYLKNVLGEEKSSFVNNLVSLVSNDKALQECVPATVMFAGLKATALKLPLDNNLGFAYVIPYGNGKTGAKEAQFQMGYKGIVQLAIRSGQFQTINVTDVREGELKSRNRMTGEVDVEWIEDDAIRAKLPIIGYIGYFKLLSGYSKTTYWSVEDLKQHGVKYSKTYKFGKGVWNDNFDAMARKTVLKLMLNKGDAPMSVEMQEAIKYDQSVILDEQGTHRYVDNEKPTDQEKLDAILEAEKKIEDAEVIDVEYSASGEIAFDK